MNISIHSVSPIEKLQNFLFIFLNIFNALVLAAIIFYSFLLIYCDRSLAVRFSRTSVHALSKNFSAGFSNQRTAELILFRRKRNRLN